MLSLNLENTIVCRECRLRDITKVFSWKLGLGVEWTYRRCLEKDSEFQSFTVHFSIQ